MTVNYFVLLAWLILLALAVLITVGVLPPGMSLGMLGIIIGILATRQDTAP